MPKENFDNEAELLLLVSQGDAQAFRQIFITWSGHVYSLSLRLTKDTEQAKDLTQEIFARLWSRREKLGAVVHFRGFLTTMALNLIRNHLQKKVLAINNMDFLTTYFAECSPTPDRAVEFKELQDVLQEAVDHLPPQLNRSFILSRQEGLSHAEIARKMQLSPLTIKNHIARALTFIRTYLEEHHAHVLLSLLCCLLKNFF